MAYPALTRLLLLAALATALSSSGCGKGASQGGPASTTSAAAVSLSTSSLTFTATVGSASAAQSVTITNTGNASLNINSISVSGTNASSFSNTTTCGASLASGASCVVSITFQPSVAGALSATLTLSDNVPTSPQTVSLMGTGQAPSAQLSSVALTFSTAYGTTAASQQVQITNSGSAPLVVTGITLTGANAASFTQSNNCATVAPAASCTLTVGFIATAVGTYSAGISITDNAGSSSLTLSGTVTGAAVTLSSSQLSFTTPAESTSGAQTVTVTNSGNATLNVSGIALTGANAANFAETTTCGATLAAGNTCTVTMTFSPYLVLVNGYTAVVAISSNAVSGSTNLALSGTATGTLTINTTNPTGWTISTGAINLTWNSTTGNVVSIRLAGDSNELVDTTTLSSNGQPDGLYMDNVGTGTTTCTANYQQIANEYIDWWETCPSNAANAFTYTRHFVVTANDPGLHVYYVAAHSSTDIAGSLGQVQYLIRISQTLFNNTYSNNSGLNNLGPTTIPLFTQTSAQSSDPGRAVQNAVEDLHGITLPAGYGRTFDTKYDYSSYEYLHQEHGVYGTQYGAWAVLPNPETLIAGPTKQDLIFTGNILMMEALSSHLDVNLGYTPVQGVASSRLFGPYYFAFNKFDSLHATPAALYAEAQQYLPFFKLLYDNEALLLTSGYTVSTGRGNVAPTIAGGGSSTANTAWTVLSDTATNFQLSTNGMQYWTNDTTTGGTAPITGVAPGTYRLSKYVLGQWGELRYDGVVVTAGQTTTPPAMTFTPENFSAYAPIWTIGTPDRSAHEFLHGSNTYGNTGSCTGCDDREYYGNWNFWKDFAATNGLQVYYATAVGSIPASTPTAMNYVLWQQFDPGLYAGVYNAADDTTDGYTYAIPSYVAGLSNAAGTNGVSTTTPGMEIHFTTTTAQLAQGAYTILSLGLACAEGSVTVKLNGSQSIYHYSNASDCMIRSGLSGYYEWGALEWPTSVLKAAGQENVMSLSASTPDGVMWDALRLEIGSKSANPTVTGWHDYGYGNTGSTFTYQNDAVPNN